MKIQSVNTATYIGNFYLRNDGSRNKIDLVYDSRLSKDYLSSDDPRIYIITSDNVIKKIGGSASKGGIKSTMIFYISSMTGSPGAPRFVIHLLIEKELKLGKEVQLFMITSPRVKSKVYGLFGYKETEIASFKETEDYCKEDYFKTENRYPDWNFQENRESYPQDEANQHNEYHKNRLIKAK